MMSSGESIESARSSESRFAWMSDKTAYSTPRQTSTRPNGGIGKNRLQRRLESAAHRIGSGTNANVRIERRRARFADPNAARQQFVHDVRCALRRSKVDANEIGMRFDVPAAQPTCDIVVIVARFCRLANDVAPKRFVGERCER